LKGNNVEFCKTHEAFESRIEKTEKDIQTLYGAVDKIRNRLPVWATFLIAALTAAVGWLVK